MPTSSLPAQNPTDNATLASCAVHSRAEILVLLRSIKQHKLLVNLDLPGSRQIIVTSLLAIDEAHNALILDSAQGDVLNNELMSGKSAEFITQLEGVSISFPTGSVTLCEHDHLPALRVALPSSLIRLQRREHFRVQLPTVRPIKCVVPSALTDELGPITAHVVDIGCGGVALAESGGRLGTEAGRLLADCQMLLPEIGSITVTLEIRNSAQIRLQNGAFQTRLGCQFIGLPNTITTQLQRLVMNIERVQRSNA